MAFPIITYDYPQSVEAQIAERLGGMVSPYDGTRFRSLKESDIEHIIATPEGRNSGLCAASAAVRARFARDLDNLTLATPASNRHEKSALDAAEWLPEHNRCWFAGRVLAVKLEYGLAVDPTEAGGVLDGCRIEDVLRPSRPPSPKAAVAAALDALVAELVLERPADAAAYTERLRAYLEVHPAFYGSAAALLDEARTVSASPYVYRTASPQRPMFLP